MHGSISPYKPPSWTPPSPEREAELELPAPSSKEYLDQLRAEGASTPPNAWMARADRMREVANEGMPRHGYVRNDAAPRKERAFHPYR